jgi:site-specific DNA-methyltransferase (adenine-specific)
MARHPSLKPQSFLRQLVFVALPLGEGLVVDPFMGSGSTVAAAEYLGFSAIGLERDAKFFAMAENAIPALASIEVDQAEREEIIESQLKLLEGVDLDGGKSSLLPSCRIRYA